MSFSLSLVEISLFVIYFSLVRLLLFFFIQTYFLMLSFFSCTRFFRIISWILVQSQFGKGFFCYNNIFASQRHTLTLMVINFDNVSVIRLFVVGWNFSIFHLKIFKLFRVIFVYSKAFFYMLSFFPQSRVFFALCEFSFNLSFFPTNCTFYDCVLFQMN